MKDRRWSNLTHLANEAGSDKGTTNYDAHNYTALYNLIFREFRDQPISFLEIGLARGGPENVNTTRPECDYSPSVDMWLKYFPNAQVFGFDITDFSKFKHERFCFVHGDASQPADLERLAATASHFDIIMDDGSHASPHQQLAFKYLYPRLAPGGLYIIEDLHWQSEVYESLVPGVPKTADFFAALLQHDRYLSNPLFEETEIRAALGTLEIAELFPGFDGSSGDLKLLVMRKGI